MLKAKNIIISIITMAAVLFSIVMLPNTALAATVTEYRVTSDGVYIGTSDEPVLQGTILVPTTENVVFAGFYADVLGYYVKYEGIDRPDPSPDPLPTIDQGGGGYKLRTQDQVFHLGETIYFYWLPDERMLILTRPAPTGNSGSEESGYAHVHNFVHCIITNPTEEMDGLEGEQCVCGAIRNTSVISSDIVFYENLYKKIDNAKSGQTIVLELKRRNTFTKEFLEKLATKNNTNFVIRLTGNDNKRYEISVQAGALDGMEFTEKYYGYKAVAGFLEMQEIAR